MPKFNAVSSVPSVVKNLWLRLCRAVISVTSSDQREQVVVILFITTRFAGGHGGHGV